MLTKIENEQGVISYNEALVSQILAEAIKPWEGRAKYLSEREIRFTDDGLYVYAGISIRLGFSMKDIAESIINFVAEYVENSLELPIEDIIVEVLTMTTSRGSVERNIKFGLREKYARED